MRVPTHPHPPPGPGADRLARGDGEPLLAWARRAGAIAHRRVRGRRRLYFTAGGAAFSAGTLAVGFAAVNTGNNLLYLLLGGMLGLMVVSGWLSNRMLRGVSVHRKVPRGVRAGRPATISYQLRNRRRHMPALALEISEAGLPGSAFVGSVRGGAVVTARWRARFTHRGVYPLERLVLSTSFPFGLFRKEIDVSAAAELVIWPSTDRKVREPVASGTLARRRASALVGVAGARGEYRALRGYRPGDDPRDIHWRSTARRGEPVVREYEGDGGESLWICLDTRSHPGPRSEAALETAAALAARATAKGERFGLALATGTVGPGTGRPQLERVLDALARVRFGVRDQRVPVPADSACCVLVAVTGNDAHRFGDCITVGGRP